MKFKVDWSFFEGSAAAALLCAYVLFGGLAACGRKSNLPANQASMKTAIIPVEGMSCVKCAARIKKTLAAINGVGEAEVSFEEHAARVRFDASRVPLCG
ncbi:MAG: cation transporter [Elusimicrobia bacterium]|nr:cation transporter [Elusimicrobiota bacterium]MDE2313797.1 cation transporter [Elusimicrobiota bacterium]